jgi:hypothetical protein
MSAPVVVSIPYKLGRDEAMRRIKGGFGRMRAEFASVFTVDQEVWTENRLTFRLRAFAQSSAGTIDFFDDHLRLEVTLPWLLAKLSETLVPAIRRQTTLLLEKK